MRTRALAAAALVVVFSLFAAPAFADSTNVPIGDFPNTVVISPDGARAYTVVAVAGGVPGRLAVVDTATDAVIGDVTVGVEPRDVVVSPDGSLIYVSNINSNSVSVIDAASLAVVETWIMPDSISGEGAWGLALGADGSRLYVSNRGGGRVDVVDTATGTVLQSYPALGLPAGVQIDEDAGFLYVALSQSTVVRRIDLTDGTAVDVDIAPAPSPFLMTLSPDGGELWVAPWSGSELVIIDTDPFAASGSIALSGTPRRPAFAADGLAYVPIGTDAGLVDVIDVASRTVLGATAVGSMPQGVAALPDQRHAYAVNLLGGGALTFFGPPIVLTHPADTTVDDGGTATFSVTTRATVDSIVWQKSTDGGATWQDVPGATSTSLSVEAVAADDGALFRVVLHSELFGDATSNVGRLTVIPTLAPTGADVAGPLTLGAVLLAVGLALTAASRRRQTR